ncbi:hypothetical protein GXW83_25855 [Streptacidiphilus sp. PB12-B1b]|uniref:hypothetical protein n=1 Tax=Streptacidiphilus sp. PB12-B1b TaxID=2705012 RepID=UPI0015F9EF90|nr:hypothetical protein [Streptacidiphilus sp. PB12-B1b]QMU78620.1 hypothetical protein GXW83_25855 [Streptacidiphilus sp. PB12-B1b]
MRTNLRTSVVAVMATLCVAMGAGTALADCVPSLPTVTSGGAVFGAAAANGDGVAYDGPSGHAVLVHHSVAGVFAARG